MRPFPPNPPTPPSNPQAGTHSCLPLLCSLQDANVFLSLSGTLRTEETFELDKCLNHTDKFERGCEDIFEFRFPPLGNLLSAKVMHDNSGLTNPDVCRPSPPAPILFLFLLWLSASF